MWVLYFYGKSYIICQVFAESEFFCEWKKRLAK